MGGGVFCSNSSLEISNSVITESVAFSGGGLGADDCDITVEGSIFSGNQATGESERGMGFGGGAFFSDSNGSISNSTLTENEAMEGGGVAVYDGRLEVSGNYIGQNIALTENEDLHGPGGGGGSRHRR